MAHIKDSTLWAPLFPHIHTFEGAKKNINSFSHNHPQHFNCQRKINKKHLYQHQPPLFHLFQPCFSSSMEGPMNSSINKNTDIVAEDASEESGWTAYLEDFSCSNGSFVISPSLVSDAAWNGSDSIRRLNFKNLKRSSNHRKFSYDDDLEDTASSPVNSPKVSTLKEVEVNCRRIDDVASGNFLGKQAGSNNFSEHGAEERNRKNVIDSRNIDQYVELRKRGLCLVPMSALMNYLG